MAKKKVGKNKAALAKVLTARVMLKKVDKPVVIIKRPSEVPETKQIFFMGKKINTEQEFLFR